VNAALCADQNEMRVSVPRGTAGLERRRLLLARAHRPRRHGKNRLWKDAEITQVLGGEQD